MKSNTNFSKSQAYRIPIIIAIIMSIILFVPAGSLLYWEAWIYWFITFAATMFFASYFFKRNPKLLARRSTFREKEPQKMAMRILSFLSVVSLFIPGLDYRFNWSSVPVWLVLISNAAVFFGFVFIFFVFKENSFASTIIQVEKEQQVITTGPYAIVRHPMYTGMLFILLFTPLALGSYWALIYFLLTIPTIVFRIKKEEEVLKRDLPGYKDYCSKARYRLIPFIW